MKKKLNITKIIKRIVLGVILAFAMLIVGLSIYSSTSYESLPAMGDAIEDLDLSFVTYKEEKTSIKYIVEQPKMNIIFVPGGLVEPDSYKYLAAGLAMGGYNVTIVKVLFNLAILTPNSPGRYIDQNLDNVIIGHSLGGVVASMVASNHSEISKIIMMGSYPIKNIIDQASLFITAEHDDAMDQEKFNDSLKYVNDENIIYNIEGGNHAQFGWYGPQKGDGIAEITTLQQQNIIISQILLFLNN